MHFLGSSALITVSKQNRWFHFQVSRVQPTLWFISRIFFSKFEQPQYGRTKKSLRSVKFLQIILQSNIALQEKVFLREKCVFLIKKVCQPAEVMDWFSSISGKLHVFRSKPEENVPRYAYFIQFVGTQKLKTVVWENHVIDSVCTFFISWTFKIFKVLRTPFL